MKIGIFSKNEKLIIYIRIYDKYMKKTYNINMKYIIKIKLDMT